MKGEERRCTMCYEKRERKRELSTYGMDLAK
jgi:hypothetical protein